VIFAKLPRFACLIILLLILQAPVDIGYLLNVFASAEILMVYEIAMKLLSGRQDYQFA
jgi:hypothetical protein